MSKTAQVIGTSIGIAVMAAMLIAAVVCGFRMTPETEPCRSLTYIFEDRAERMYVSEAELNQLLQAENIYPVGKSMDRVALYRVERAIGNHPMVRNAECYLTPRHEMRVQITQRVPLLRVQTPGDTYFIDTDRRVMPVRASVKDSVPVVRGAVGVQIASGALADFALWLKENSYWHSRIRYLYVQNPQMIYLYLKDENGAPAAQRIVLGSMRGYERKLAKLRTFLEQGREVIQNKQYSEYDLRFKSQVVARQ